MKKIFYFGVRSSGLSIRNAEFSRALEAPTPDSSGIAVATTATGKKGVVVPWGDVMVCVQKALSVSPEMRADLKVMLDEHALKEAQAYTADGGA